MPAYTLTIHAETPEDLMAKVRALPSAWVADHSVSTERAPRGEEVLEPTGDAIQRLLRRHRPVCDLYHETIVAAREQLHVTIQANKKTVTVWLPDNRGAGVAFRAGKLLLRAQRGSKPLRCEVQSPEDITNAIDWLRNLPPYA